MRFDLRIRREKKKSICMGKKIGPLLLKMIKICGVVLIASFMIAFGAEIGGLVSLFGSADLVPKAEAWVGRPLTPVSVAGVARRSVRRCAVGVYRCSLPDAQSLLLASAGETHHAKP